MPSSIYVALSSFAHQDQEPLNRLKNSGRTFDVNTTGQRLKKDQLVQALKNCTAVLAGLEVYDQDVLLALPQLKCISRCGVGIDNIDLKVAAERNIKVFNTPQVVVQPVAELTLAFIFDLLRNTTAHALSMRGRKWERLTGSQLAGKTVGIIGLGRIGQRVSQLLSGLGAHVQAYDASPNVSWAQAHGIVLCDLAQLLASSDIVTLHIGPSSENPFCLDKQLLGSMKKGAYVVNTARGSLIDEVALYSVLSSGHLAGAALDVFAQEPYNGPLCDLPNAILTPHCATLTRESRAAMEIEAVDNLLAFLNS